MKHTEQLQPRSPNPRRDTLHVHNKTDDKEKRSGKCCGGGTSDSGENVK